MAQTDNNFNPRSREGSDVSFSGRYGVSKAISIHAPVKGATTYGADHPRRDQYFNPRSREGSDPLPPNKWYNYYFNPRSREGSDGRGRVGAYAP